MNKYDPFYRKEKEGKGRKEKNVERENGKNVRNEIAYEKNELENEDWIRIEVVIEPEQIHEEGIGETQEVNIEMIPVEEKIAIEEIIAIMNEGLFCNFFSLK